MSHKVAIIGAGNVGTSLGASLLDKGFSVKYGVRNIVKYKNKLLKQQPAATIAGIDEAIAWSDVVIIAIPGSFDDAGIQAAAASFGHYIEGKIVIDATNPLSAYPALEIRDWSLGNSAGEVFAAALPKSYVYKAFNTIGAEHMAAAAVESALLPNQGKLTMLFAGSEDENAKKVVADVIEGVGFEPCYVGPIRYSRNLEAMAELWIHLGVGSAGFTKENWGRNFHFQKIAVPSAASAAPSPS